MAKTADTLETYSFTTYYITPRRIKTKGRQGKRYSINQAKNRDHPCLKASPRQQEGRESRQKAKTVIQALVTDRQTKESKPRGKGMK
jgi:hypothetical protein